MLFELSALLCDDVKQEGNELLVTAALYCIRYVNKKQHQTEKISRSPLQPDKLQGISASYSLCFVSFAFFLSFVMRRLFFFSFFGRGNNLRQELAKLKQLAFSFQLSP